jgi:YjbE family integral membrane protein
VIVFMGTLVGKYFVDAVSIILVNILLSGDNAVVIAMAVRTLPTERRKVVIGIGVGVAALLRIVLTFFAAELLSLNYIRLLGGLLILWIGVKLLTEAAGDAPAHPRPVTLWHAVWMILIADVTMSTDNILAVAGLSKSNPWLLVFGLGFSIGIVMFTSSILAGFMDRYPVVMYIGAAILGRVGGDMMVSDPWIQKWLHPSEVLSIGTQIFFTGAVLVTGWFLARHTVKQDSDLAQGSG